ncbi:hypothetical protein S40288_03086 [Stachybotrys chartarum IBT 40288]|nr:hypothetical protein S40288_03086 [Stachybotrys chartarum IBT 40288]
MPGVPKSKGCDGCIKVKKGCDLLKPSCSRCTRLGMQCTGTNSKRYKFLHVHLQPHEHRIPVTESRFLPVAFIRDPLSLMPTNSTTRTASAFVARLEVHDVRYDISAYGGFLKYLPQRLGVNRSLDAAMDAFSVAFSNYNSEPYSLAVFRKYVKAISAVRDCVSRPDGETLVETICAIYLLMLVQAWMGRQNDGLVSHEEGLAYLLDIIANNGCHDEFDTLVFAVIAIPVVYASMTNSRINLGPAFWSIMQRLAPPNPPTPEPLDEEMALADQGGTFPSLHFQNLGKLPRFLREPESHYGEILYIYDMVQRDIPRFEAKLAEMPILLSQLDTPNARTRRDIQSAYAMALAMAIVLNQILEAFGHFSSKWSKDCNSFIKKIINVAEEASRFRPIGAGFMVGSLSIAWAATAEPKLKKQLQYLKDEFFKSFKGENWENMATWWFYKYMEIRFRLGRPRPGDDYEKAMRESAKFVSCVQCAASHNYIENPIHT